MGGYAWSEEEMKILRRIYEGETTLIEGSRLLPKRTISAIRNRVAGLGWGPRGSRSRSHYRWVQEEVIRALRERGPMDCHQLAALTTASLDRIRQITKEGHGETFHVHGWKRIYQAGSHTPIWAFGQAEDAPTPPRQTRVEKRRRDTLNQKMRRGAINPFLPAAGLVQAPSGEAGRVYKQSMEVDEWIHRGLGEAA